MRSDSGKRRKLGKASEKSGETLSVLSERLEQPSLLQEHIIRVMGSRHDYTQHLRRCDWSFTHFNVLFPQSDMRHQDKYLTRQFIQLRATIQRIKSENTLLDGLDPTVADPSFRHSVPGPTLRPTLGRSISYM